MRLVNSLTSSPRGLRHTFSSVLKRLHAHAPSSLSADDLARYFTEKTHSHSHSHQPARTLTPQRPPPSCSEVRGARAARQRPDALSTSALGPPAPAQGHRSCTSSSFFCIITFPAYRTVLISTRTRWNASHRKN